MSETESQEPGRVTPADDRVPVHPVLWVMIAVMVGFEIAFALEEAGWLPQVLGRAWMYYRFAFFDVLFDYWLGDQRIVLPEPAPDTLRLHTFLTHAFLHGGWLHLALNGAAFLGIGHVLVRAFGIGRFLILFALCAIAGALAFGFIAEAEGPMVGASGALFGMLAVITAWQERFLRLSGLSRSPIWRRIGALVLLNVVLAVALQGMLAWEAHLGGWVVGWLLAYVFRPRFGPFSRAPLTPGERYGNPAADPDADRPATTPQEPAPPPRS